MNVIDNQKRKAQILKALGHPTRLHIVEILLSGEKCVNDIKEIFETTQPNISQHLNILKFSGIVDYRQEGNLRCYYLINAEKIKNLVQAAWKCVHE
jgi:ArsR family transcriptional regulator